MSYQRYLIYSQLDLKYTPVICSGSRKQRDLRNRDADDDIVQLQLILLKFVLNVHVTTALAVVRGPAVN